MAHFAMPPELSAWLAHRLTFFPWEAPEQLRWPAPFVIEYAALPLYGLVGHNLWIILGAGARVRRGGHSWDLTCWIGCSGLRGVSV
jgi:hypothetical protein